MNRLDTEEKQETEALWEGLAASCAPPLRRLGGFAIVGLAAFVAITMAMVVLYNIFGHSELAGHYVFVPGELFYAATAAGAAVTLGGYAIWLYRGLRSYRYFAGMLRARGLDPHRPTFGGLGSYSDEQLLSLRSRYEHTHTPAPRRLFEKTFGFDPEDSFRIAPLSALPDTFEMDALRVEWEANLILNDKPRISWLTESRRHLLPRSPNRILKLVYERRYTADSVRELRRRYGYRTDRWHRTIPEGKLWDAFRDFEDARRIQSALDRRVRQG
jgi:hypothetical protein